MSHPDRHIVIAGAGPAGMVLAYQLASRGMRTTLVERHEDFQREFRGETLHEPGIQILEALGLMAPLRAADAVVDVSGAEFFLNEKRVLRHQGQGPVVGVRVSQPALLELLHERCSRLPTYRMLLGTAATGLHLEAGRVVGLRVRRDGAEEVLRADLVVVCCGRGTPLRKQAGLTAQKLLASRRILWMRFAEPREPALQLIGMTLYMKRESSFFFVPTARKGEMQVAWARRADDAAELAVHDIDILRDNVVADAPTRWKEFFRSNLRKDTPRAVFNVTVDRLDRFWAPGVVFLGDAAHTMNEIGGMGVQLAMEDAVVAANHILDAAPGADLAAIGARIDAERRPAVTAAQAEQQRMAWMVHDAPAPLQRVFYGLMSLLLRGSKGKAMRQRFQVSVRYPPPPDSTT